MTIRLTLLGPRDERGRCDFQLEWWGYRVDLDAKGPRGQHFYAKPEDHVADLERRGYRVVGDLEASAAA